MHMRRILVLVASAAVIVGACSSGSASTAPASAASAAAASQAATSQAPSAAASAARRRLGAASAAARACGRRRARRSTCWPGPASRERHEQTRRQDWVTGFPEVERLHGQGPDSGPRMRPTRLSTNPGRFDVVSASGDASLRLDRVAASSSRSTSDLFKSYPDIFAALKDKPYNTVDGVDYGVPHGRGSNLLMWQHRPGHAGPDSLGPDVRSEPNKYKVSVYDAPIYIADAAVVPDEDQPDPRDHQPVRPR